MLFGRFSVPHDFFFLNPCFLGFSVFFLFFFFFGAVASSWMKETGGGESASLNVSIGYSRRGRAGAQGYAGPGPGRW